MWSQHDVISRFELDLINKIQFRHLAFDLNDPVAHESKFVSYPEGTKFKQAGELLVPSDFLRQPILKLNRLLCVLLGRATV